MNIKKFAVSAVAAGIMLASAVPAFASTSVTISGNGALSHNGATVVNWSKSSVKQTNTTKVNTFVLSWSNTGGNSSSFNTGGSNTTTTGGAGTTVGIDVTGGSNTNTGGSCGCQSGNTTVDISGNGAFSNNGVTVVNSSSNSVTQTNNTTVNTAVVSSSNTGDNSSSFNTGGSSSITTGGAGTTVGVMVGGSTNSN